MLDIKCFRHDIEQVAKELGFQHVVVTNDVNDDAVINRIVEIGQKNG